MENRFNWGTRPKASEGNTVKGKGYRFTVLTDSLIRIELNGSGAFEDRASQTVFYRDFPKTEFKAEIKDGKTLIETKKLLLKYSGEEKLSVKLKEEPASVWNLGDDFEDLKGTTETLDATNGEVPLKRGLCSRYGFSVLDDSENLLLDENGRITPREENTKDIYFFGYGYDYLGCIRDFYRLTGAPSFLPAYAFGNWWSRYYNYTQDEYIETMDRFNKEDIPLSVGIVDMDWHTTEIPEDKKNPEPIYNGYWNTENGWTGYSFNKEYFPDHIKFLKQLKERNIHTAFNLHPHAGIRCHEDMYEEMAVKSGIDPNSKKTVPFDVLSEKFMSDYFDTVLHPYEKDGVDFWWMDWQQGKDYWWIHDPNKDGKLKDKREAVDPLWMINHLYTLDISRNGKRPMFFSRYSGPGSQRYSIGFSGDTFITWSALDFQPYFTSTASNIGYCWWSHDVGGHMHGYKDEELTARWIQLGVFSPINRLHSSNDMFIHKEPWLLKNEYRASVKKWLKIRHELFPYIYTMNFNAATKFIPLVRPLYYYYPKKDAAYEIKNQFFFGSELMVAPITKPASKITGKGETKVFLPKGNWYDFFAGTRYYSENGRKIKAFRSIEDYPVFAKSGAIVPLKPHVPHDNSLCVSDTLDIYVFPSASNSFELFEDSGDGDTINSKKYAVTKMNLSWGENPEFSISSAKGETSVLPRLRTWNLKFRGFSDFAGFEVLLNGSKTRPLANYDFKTHTIEISVSAKPTDSVSVIFDSNNCIAENSDILKACEKILQDSKISTDEKNEIYSILTDCELNTHFKILKISGRSYEKEDLADTIKEILTRTEGEYDL